jgi:hypothetical protein
MGDGQHAWAAADWVLAVRNFFVREEEGEVILLSGVPEAWLRQEGATVSLGPTPTTFGPLTVVARREGEGVRVSWHGEERGGGGRIRVGLPDFESVVAPRKKGEVWVYKRTES